VRYGSAISREVVAVREGEFLDILGLFFRESLLWTGSSPYAM
jgi:hypothetical protein